MFTSVIEETFICKYFPHGPIVHVTINTVRPVKHGSAAPFMRKEITSSPPSVFCP